MKRRNLPALCFAALSVLLLAALLTLFFHGQYDRKLLAKLGLRNPLPNEAVARKAWTTSLEQLECDADVAFLGDSLTQRSDFRAYFPGVRICNLGMSRDTVEGMLQRVKMVAAVHPKLVLVEGGVNGLGDDGLRAVLDQYARLMDSLREALPEAEIVIQSCMPLSRECERIFACKNETICALNGELRQLAEARGMPFVDLYSLYERDGWIDPEVTPDGVHLNAADYAPWADAIRPYVESLTSG